MMKEPLTKREDRPFIAGVFVDCDWFGKAKVAKGSSLYFNYSNDFISSFLNSVICWEVDDFSFVLAGFKLNNILMKTPYNIEKIMLKNLELKL